MSLWLSVAWILSGSSMLVTSLFYPIDESTQITNTFYMGTQPLLLGLTFIILGLIRFRLERNDKLKNHDTINKT